MTGNCYNDQWSFIPLFLVISCFFYPVHSSADDFTLEELVTGANLSRGDITSGELRVMVSERYEPEKTPEEAREWANTNKQTLMKERENDPDADSPSRKEYYDNNLQAIEATAQKYQDRRAKYQEKIGLFRVKCGK